VIKVGGGGGLGGNRDLIFGKLCGIRVFLSEDKDKEACEL
jgi:hypothetical protein